MKTKVLRFSYAHFMFSLPTLNYLKRILQDDGKKVHSCDTTHNLSPLSPSLCLSFYGRVPGSFGSNESKTEFRRNQRIWLAYTYISFVQRLTT